MEKLMKTISVTEAKARLNEIIREIEENESYYLTKNGRLACVLLNVAEWESIQETFDVLSDSDLMRQLTESERTTVDYSLDDVFGDV
jgi:antitoxin YefM